MKRVIISLIMATTMLSAQAIQSYESAQGGGSYYPSETQTTKIYTEHGSYQGKLVPQSNGTLKQYGKYGSYEGYYKPNGSGKVKYYQANSKKAN